MLFVFGDQLSHILSTGLKLIQI